MLIARHWSAVPSINFCWFYVRTSALLLFLERAMLGRGLDVTQSLVGGLRSNVCGYLGLHRIARVKGTKKRTKPRIGKSGPIPTRAELAVMPPKR